VFAASSTFACYWAGVPLRIWATALAPIVVFALLGSLPLWWMGFAPERVLSVPLRSIAAGSAALLLVTTTPAEELLASAQRIRGLGLFVEMTFLSLRLFSILRESAISTIIAWHCRRGDRTWAGFRYSLHAVASLFATGFGRARRMDKALALRSRNDELRFWAPARQPHPELPLAGILAGGLLGSAALLLRESFPWR
jgi:energy-coupling factor transporter transmembrane protein EcfT